MSLSPKECRLDFCVSPRKARELCSGHYAQYRKGQELRPIVPGKRNHRRYVTDTEARCSRCLRVLPLNRFQKGSGKAGLATWCAKCFVMYKYGLTSMDYERMYEEQNGACAGCFRVDVESFHTDHDHSCCVSGCPKCVRSLLCPQCNQVLGMVKEDPMRLVRLARYLERWSI